MYSFVANLLLVIPPSSISSNLSIACMRMNRERNWMRKLTPWIAQYTIASTHPRAHWYRSAQESEIQTWKSHSTVTNPQDSRRIGTVTGSITVFFLDPEFSSSYCARTSLTSFQPSSKGMMRWFWLAAIVVDANCSQRSRFCYFEHRALSLKLEWRNPRLKQTLAWRRMSSFDFRKKKRHSSDNDTDIQTKGTCTVLYCSIICIQYSTGRRAQ